MKRSSVRPSVQSIDRSSGARRVYCRVPCGQEISIDSDVQLAPSLSSKCGQCRVDSRRRRLDADLFTGKHVSVLSFRFRHPLTTKRNRRCDFRVSVCVGPTRRCRVWSTSWYRASTEVRDVHIYLHRSVTLPPPLRGRKLSQPTGPMGCVPSNFGECGGDRMHVDSLQLLFC